MATSFQLANNPGATDYAFQNLTGSAIASGLVVTADSGNALSSSNFQTAVGIPVKLPTADGAIAIGLTMESIADKAIGRVRCLGPIGVFTASGTVTVNTVVMVEANTGKVKTQTAAKAQMGYALTTAATGEPVIVMLIGGFNA